MALFKLDWAFPTQESSFAGGEQFLEYLQAGGPSDETEGFKILWRVTNPLNGTGTFVAEVTEYQQNVGTRCSLDQRVWMYVRSRGCVLRRAICYYCEKNILILSN